MAQVKANSELTQKDSSYRLLRKFAVTFSLGIVAGYILWVVIVVSYNFITVAIPDHQAWVKQKELERDRSRIGH